MVLEIPTRISRVQDKHLNPWISFPGPIIMNVMRGILILDR